MPEQRVPGPDHPITIEPHEGRITVSVGGTVVAESSAALDLHEASYPVVHYLPMADVEREFLRASDTTTHCPYKGDASYYSLETDGTSLPDVVWYYPKPYDAVAAIGDHVAFYADKVDVSA